MLGIINSKNISDIKELIAYLSINDCADIFIKKFTLNIDEFEEIKNFCIDYGVNLIFDEKKYSFNKIENYNLNIKLINSNIDEIIEIQRQNLDELLIFKDDVIIYYNKSIIIKNKLCLIIDN